MGACHIIVTPYSYHRKSSTDALQAIDENEPRIKALTFKIKKNKEEIAELTESIGQAQAIRDGETEKYTQEKELNMASIGQLNVAVKVM